MAEVGGDQWHDNASYELLVIDIRGTDRRISDAHQSLGRAILVEPPRSLETVAIGTRVRVMRDGREIIWEIVGFGESGPSRRMLAYNTPLAFLIMGKRINEVVHGTIASRKTKIEILEISRGGVEDVRSS